MSTQSEKIRAQEIAFTACGSRHLIGPVELKQLFDDVERLRERIRRLESACGVQMNPKHDASAQSDESRMDWLLKNSCIKVNNLYYTTRESLDATMLANV